MFEITPGASPGDSSEASIGNIRLLPLPGKAFFPRLPGICVTQLSIGVHDPSSWAEFGIAPIGSQETLMCLSFPPTLVVPVGSREWPGPSPPAELTAKAHPGAGHTSVQTPTPGHVTKPYSGLLEAPS